MFRRVKISLLCPLVVMLLFVLVQSQDNVPSGTSFCIQVESIPVQAPWQFKTDKAGYYGSGYFYYNSDSRGQGVLDYHFDLTEPGTYKIRYHGRRDREGICSGARDDMCNDIFTSLDDLWSDCKTMVKQGGWGT